MKGKINVDGFLSIMRVVDYELQVCPFTNRVTDKEDSFPCGDWCPLFGEPSNENEGGHITLSIESLRSAAELIKRKQGVAFFVDEVNAIPEGVGVSLQLCHKTLIFSEFDDERCWR
jgi:hypothetical protein